MRNCTVTTTILLAVRTCGFYSCSIPADEGKLRGMFSRLSLQTVYRRFHTPFLQVPKRMAALFTKVDRYRRGVVAVVGTEIVGTPCTYGWRIIGVLTARIGGRMLTATAWERGCKIRAFWAV
jgi:hypothetical protein